MRLVWVFVWLVAALALSTPARAGEPSPCGVLTADEVATVLGEPIAEAPFRTNGAKPDPAGDTCRYESASLKSIDVTVSWTDGKRDYDIGHMITEIVQGATNAVVKLSSGEEVSGRWDAARDFLCCQFDALSGDRMVRIEIGASQATLLDAAKLADMAIARLVAPADVDADLGIAAAEARDNTRPPIRNACDLLSTTEAEAIVGVHLGDKPEGDEARCTIHWTNPNGDYADQLDWTLTWRGGLAEMRQTQAAIGQATAMFDFTEGADSNPDAANFDAYSDSIVGVMAVRRDVMISVEREDFDHTIARAIVAAVGRHL